VYFDIVQSIGIHHTIETLKLAYFLTKTDLNVLASRDIFFNVLFPSLIFSLAAAGSRNFFRPDQTTYAVWTKQQRVEEVR